MIEQLKIGDKIMVFNEGNLELIEVSEIYINTYDIIDNQGKKWCWFASVVVDWTDESIEFMKGKK